MSDNKLDNLYDIKNYEKRIYLKGNRIRDLDYDKDLDLIVLLSENIPSIITLKVN